MKRVFVVLGAVVLLTGLGVGGIHLWALTRIRHHEREARALLLQQQARSRPPLFGPAIPGNAPELYSKDLSRLSDAEVIAALREALRRTDLADTERTVDPLVLHHLMWILEILIDPLRRNGQDEEAFELLTIGFGVAQDMLGVAPWILGGGEAEWTEMGLAILQSHRLTAPQLEEIARRLDAVARTRPPLADYFRFEEAIERREALKGYRLIHSCRGMNPIPVGPNSLWLPSVARAATLNEISSYYRRQEEVGRLSPRERLDAEEIPLPWSQGDRYGRKTCQRAEIESLALRAILRAAVAVAWYAEKECRVPEKLSDIPGYAPDWTAEFWTYSAGVLTCPLRSKSWTIRRRP